MSTSCLLIDSYLTSFLLIFCHDTSTFNQSSCQKQGWEFIMASEFFETYDSVDGDSVTEANDGWEHLDSQFWNEERTFLCIDFGKLGFSMLSWDFLKMHIHDLASFKIFMIESKNNKSSSSDCWQKLLFGDLDILTMSIGQIFLMLLLFIFQHS